MMTVNFIWDSLYGEGKESVIASEANDQAALELLVAMQQWDY